MNPNDLDIAAVERLVGLVTTPVSTALSNT